MRQGFYFDMTACIGCRTCQIACKDKNDLPAGVVFRNVTDYEVGAYPNVATFHYSGSCNHCEDPACVAVCPNGATFINEEDGTVQHDDTKCIGCQYCVNACPYGVPKYLEDIQLTHKCDACWTLREKGEDPACVAACPMRALEFGPIDELKAAHPDTVNQVTVLPEATQTNPSVAIQAKKAALEKDVAAVLM